MHSVYNHCANMGSKVFNSALMTFGSLLAYPKHVSNSASSDQVGACRILLARAIQTLRLLDGGNATVERCALFIEEMAHKLDVLHGTGTGIGAGRIASYMDGILPTEKGAESSRVVRFLSPNRQSDRDNVPTNLMAQNQEAVGTGFIHDHGYADELELSQFFLGGGMEAWVENQG